MATVTRILILLLTFNLLVTIAMFNGGDTLTGVSQYLSKTSVYTDDANVADNLIDNNRTSIWTGISPSSITNFVSDIIDYAKIAGAFMWLFLTPFLPLPGMNGIYSGGTPIEMMIAFVFGLMRMFMYTLLGLELFLLWRNRKVQT